MKKIYLFCQKSRRDLAGGILLLAAIFGVGLWLLPQIRDFQIGMTLVSYPLAVAMACIFELGLLYMLILGFLAFFSDPRPGIAEEQLPSCTVIVPAYNEGQHVFQTLMSIRECDYPREKLQILAINDGSGDDTMKWIRCAEESSGGQIRSIDLKNNGGKKNALYTGMKSSDSEIIVTVDSDSILKKETLRNLVAPFTDKRIGAVAGNIYAENREQTFFSTMLDVALVFGCEFLRAAQSASGTVFCTPGALSAYRRSAIAPLLDEWLQQTFLGAPARIGEDRAIATLLLRSGWRIIHQSNAVAATRMPTTYEGLCKMLIRWVRSDIRENLQMSRFVLSKAFDGNMRYELLFIHWFSMITGCVLPFLFLPLFLYSLFFLADSPGIFLAVNFFASLIWAAIPAVIYARRHNPLAMVWAFWYGLFLPVCVSWISIYALCTVRDSRWMTRELSLRQH